MSWSVDTHRTQSMYAYHTGQTFPRVTVGVTNQQFEEKMVLRQALSMTWHAHDKSSSYQDLLARYDTLLGMAILQRLD